MPNRNDSIKRNNKCNYSHFYKKSDKNQRKSLAGFFEGVFSNFDIHRKLANMTSKSANTFTNTQDLSFFGRCLGDVLFFELFCDRKKLWYNHIHGND